MKMTAAWMEETVASLEGQGFVCERETAPRELEGVVVFERTRYVLRRDDGRRRLAVEVLVYPNGTETYWLEVMDWYGLSFTPYQLDSWRHRDDRLEFKYGVDPETAMGLSFTIRYAELDQPC